MASKYFTEFSERKVSASGARPSQKVGSTASMPLKQGYMKVGLPGKAQPRNRSNGIKKLQTHAKSEGL